MKYQSSKDYLDSENKKLVLIGLSGVGKTTLANILSDEGWEQYSIDYHIGNKFLSDEIHELFEKSKTNKDFMDKAIARNSVDSITKKPVITKSNLYPISAYVSMVGRQDEGGLSELEFRNRLKNHLSAEVAATLEMIKTGLDTKTNFICDASGSLCEIVDPEAEDLILNALSDFTVVYIESNQEHDQLLVDRQKQDPKPLYYRQEFLDEHIPAYANERQISSIDEADPGDVGGWMLPRLIQARRKRYDKIINRLGYKVPMQEVTNIKSGNELNQLIAKAIDRQK